MVTKDLKISLLTSGKTYNKKSTQNDQTGCFHRKSSHVPQLLFANNPICQKIKRERNRQMGSLALSQIHMIHISTLPLFHKTTFSQVHISTNFINIK